MSKTNPFEPIVKLALAAQAAAKRVGLDLINFAVMPDLSGDDHKIQMMYGVPPDLPAAPLSDEEQAMFADMEAQMREQTEADKISDAKEGLKSLLRDPKRGLFEEDEDE